jgi:CelD/BcsL family acetyltransferase involved in cellulose biosynthesis
MREFYRSMLDSLAARTGLRVWFARLGDNDIAYTLGGVVGNAYRGLQFSFDDDYRELGLGNACQFHQLRELCDAGIEHYDLGTGGNYKHRWAEQQVTSEALVVRRG